MLLSREESFSLRLRLLFSFGFTFYHGHLFRFNTSDFAFQLRSPLNADRLLEQNLPLASRGGAELHLVALKAACELAVHMYLVFCLNLAAKKLAGYLHVPSGVDIPSAHFAFDLDAAAFGIDVALASAFDENARIVLGSDVTLDVAVHLQVLADDHVTGNLASLAYRVNSLLGGFHWTHYSILLRYVDPDQLFLF